MANQDFSISDIEDEQLKALVKNLMTQTGISDPVEAVKSFNSGEYTLVKNTSVQNHLKPDSNKGSTWGNYPGAPQINRGADGSYLNGRD